MFSISGLPLLYFLYLLYFCPFCVFLPIFSYVLPLSPIFSYICGKSLHKFLFFWSQLFNRVHTVWKVMEKSTKSLFFLAYSNPCFLSPRNKLLLGISSWPCVLRISMVILSYIAPIIFIFLLYFSYIITLFPPIFSYI